MKKNIIILIIFSFLNVLISSCVSQQIKLNFCENNLPENIYVQPYKKSFSGSRACILRFSEPTEINKSQNADLIGKMCAQYFYQELARTSFFSSITLDLTNQALCESDFIKIAKSNNCDIIITGDLLYYFEGSALSPSQVEQEIHVFSVSESGLETLWHAKAIEIAHPDISKDYIFFKTQGTQALPAMELVKKNAKKFCNLFIN